MTTTLGIWAHPDDEVFVAGGLLADAARRGERVVCIHLTGGEAGLSYGRPSSPESLADVRRDELEASLERLGVEEQRFLGYSDGHLPETPRDEVIARIHDALVEVQPDAIVTFGRDGFTGHPDHRSLSTLVTAALDVWDQPEARLLQAAVTPDWKDSFAPALNEFNVFWPGHPTAITDPDVTIELDDELLDAKVDALRAHASQMTPFFSAYGDDFMRALASTEHYRLRRVGQSDPAPRAGRRPTMKQIRTFRTKRSHSVRREPGSEVTSRPSGCSFDIDRLLTQIDCALREAAR
ncbi:MAG: PIG-L deacetylase family protein [Actinomycetota bacterium]